MTKKGLISKIYKQPIQLNIFFKKVIRDFPGGPAAKISHS